MSLNPSSALIPGLQSVRPFDNYNISEPVDIGDRIPLVYGRDVYVPEATVLSHRIGVSADGNRLFHSMVCLVSLGQMQDMDNGEIIEIERNIYSHGVKIGRSSVDTTAPTFVDWRSGTPGQSAYPQNPTRTYSYPIIGREITVPVQLPSGIPVISANVFWRSENGTDWLSQSVVPGQSVTIGGWSAWVSLNTLESTAYPALCTVLIQQQSVDERIIQPDILVKQGRKIRRISAGGRGQGEFKGSMADANNSGKTLKNISKRSDIGTKISDSDYWYTYALGISDRYPDVVFDLLSLTNRRNEYVTNFPSFAAANSHTEAEGLFFGGVVRSTTSIFDFVNRYSMVFDLIPTTVDNRMGFINHTVTSVTPSHLFTPINTEQYRLEYLNRNRHTNVDVYGLLTDWSDRNFHGSVSSVLSVNNGTTMTKAVTLSTYEVMSNRSSLLKQIERINDSINAQDVEIEIVTDSVSDTFEPGDFILVYSTTDAIGRDYVGGILKPITGYGIAVSRNVYQMSHPTATIPGTLVEQPINNQFYFYSKFTTYVRVGDLISFRLREQDETGRAAPLYSMAEITEISSTVVSDGRYKTTVKYAGKTWDTGNGKWINSATNPIIPRSTEYNIYRLFNEISGVILDQGDGVIKTPFDMLVVPINNVLTTCIELGSYKTELAEPIPAVIVENIKVWRVSGIDIWEKNLSQIVYRVSATIYPFGEVNIGSTLATIPTIPDIESTEQTNDQYPDYTFPAEVSEPIDSTKRISGLTDVDMTGFTPRPKQGVISSSSINPTPDPISTPADRPVLNAALIASRYTSAVIKINMADGQYGTGFIVSSDGTILTNEHVANNATTVVLQDGTIASIKWYKLDSGNDIAVGKITLEREYPYLEMAYTSALAVGDTVHAIGHSQPNFWSLTTQTVEALGDKCTPNNTANCYRALDGLLEAGGSGSPIFNNKGLVVGMARAIALTASGERDYFIEMTPINTRIYNEKLWVPPVGDFSVGNPLHTASSGYTRQDIAAMFMESVISSNTNSYRFRAVPDLLAKWPLEEITVSLEGIYSLRDGTNFEAYINQINSVLPRGISLKLNQITIGTTSQPTGDIRVRVIPMTQFETLTAPYSLTYPSYSYGDENGIDEFIHGEIILPFDGITDAKRARLFAREIFRCLGFIWPSFKMGASILHDGNLVEEPTTNLLDVVDQQLLKLLYRTEFDAADTRYELTTKLNRIQEL
jgi:hypothetical protein